MEEIKLGKAYQRDLVVDKRYPVIRTGEQEDKKYMRGDILDANAVQQLIDNIQEEDPKAVVERGAGENSIQQKGTGSVATGEGAMAVGSYTQASGTSAFAEGHDTKATGANSHAEGTGSEASNGSAHAEGYQCKASGDCSHAEGFQTIASGHQAHAGGIHSRATAQASFVHGDNLIMNTPAGAAFGKFNAATTEAGDPLFCIGVGSDENSRENILSVYDRSVTIGDNFTSILYSNEESAMIPGIDVIQLATAYRSGGNGCALRISSDDNADYGVKKGGSFHGDWDFSNANVTGLPEGSGAAYEVVDAGYLNLDQTETYYEVPATVYTALKTVWDEGKVPVLTGILVNHTTEFALIPTADETRSALYCYWHAYSNVGSNNSWHVAGDICSTGGRLYPEEEQKPITVDQTVQDGSQNPVSGNAVYQALASLDARVAALENNQ